MIKKEGYYVFRSSSAAESFRPLDGQICEVLWKLRSSEVDEDEVGLMYKVRFADGSLLDVFEDELESTISVLTEYEAFVDQTAVFPEERKYFYPVLGLAGEAGEVCEKVKKFIRDDGGEEFSEERRLAILQELGDCLWYLTSVAHVFDSSLDEVIYINTEKLKGRRARGTLHGDGDSR